MDAEHLKETNPDAYAHEYMGEVTGNGAEVFDNIQGRRITDDEIKGFDRIYNGVDWAFIPTRGRSTKCTTTPQDVRCTFSVN